MEAKLSADALGVGFCFAAVLLRGRLEGSQTADLVEDSLSIKLVFQPL